MKGGTESVVLVPRFARSDFIPIKHLAISVIITFITYATIIIILSIAFLPQMEESYEDTRELMEEIENGESFSIIEGEAIPEIRLVYLSSIIIFGLFDSIFTLMLWRAKSPLKNDKIISPLHSIYVTQRCFTLILISQLSIGVLTWDISEILFKYLYLTILVSSVISIVIIFIIYRKVIGEKTKEEVVFKLPKETAP